MFLYVNTLNRMTVFFQLNLKFYKKSTLVKLEFSPFTQNVSIGNRQCLASAACEETPRAPNLAFYVRTGMISNYFPTSA